MVWNYHDEDKQETVEEINTLLGGLPKTITVTEYRIDNEHSNSYEVWKKMGSPLKTRQGTKNFSKQVIRDDEA
jgi:xylan 1,4-beta-xylosidase